MEKMEKKTYEIDAKGRPLGRVASEAAIKLRGKNEATFQRHTKPMNKVKILNAKQIIISGNKVKLKEYTHYTGYPGGLKVKTMQKILNEDGGYEKVIKKAVYGMLPSNRLRDICMKNLEIIE